MRTTTALVLALGLLVALAACSSEPSQPARVANYGQTPPPPPLPGDAALYSSGSPDGGPIGRTRPAVPGTINWHTRLADAQAEARATGRLILALSTKPRCGLCEKFKTRTAPAAAGEFNRVAVGYVYDITRPEVRRVDQTLRANLRGADLMPLVGFLTPDLQFVHGFWGSRSVSEFQGDIAAATARARSIYPMRSASLDRVVRGPTTAVLNEYGEPEWSPVEDVWPTATARPAAVAAAPERTAPEPAPALAAAPAPVEPRPADLPAVAAPVEEVAALPPVPEAAPAPAPTAAPAAAPEASSPWTAPVADAEGGAAAAPAAVAGIEAIENPQVDEHAWGREALQTALAHIRDGRFAEARETLRRVRERLPDTALAREADKGAIALYNAKRIRLAASGAERSRYLTRARRDFNTSMWGVLFDA